MHAKSIPQLTPAQIERFWSKVEVHHPAGCWEWTSGITTKGYGSFAARTNDGWKNFPAHRIAYELLIGEPPAELSLDHLCRNRRCVNPDHIRVTTQTENIFAGYSVAAINRRKTHCRNGHLFTPENTRITREGWRMCITCRRKQQREWGTRRKSRAKGIKRVTSHILHTPMEEVHRERLSERWCFVCRTRREFEYVVERPIVTSIDDTGTWYGPTPHVECTVCKTWDGDCFPGTSREWNDL